MDRRGHGNSEAGANYSLRKEFDDVVAVADSRPGPVFVLGHSIGGLCALEAAFLTSRISKLVLYEPPLQGLDHTAVADRMEEMIRAGDREQALVTFLWEIVMETLPRRTLVVFEGQEHNAMDRIPQQFAETVTKFLRAQ